MLSDGSQRPGGGPADLLVRIAYGPDQRRLGLAGIAAGFLGAPRRTLDPDYGPQVWASLMVLVGLGGIIMSAALFAFLYGLARTAFQGVRVERGEETANLPVVVWQAAKPGAYPAYAGTVAMLILLVGMFTLTGLAFALLGGLP